MRVLNRWFRDRRGIPVHVIRWEPETQRVIYLRENYEYGECFSPIKEFRRDFTEIEAKDEADI
ncbi:MAG: DUF4222 domain-containing protein [Enterobacteriaceae bacterium]|nr:DUF4222 domain-containing protein [Enterobacteriaceae bacterium]